jgi:hypothetical protein
MSDLRQITARLKVSRHYLVRMVQAAQAQGSMAQEPRGVRFTESGQEALNWAYDDRLCIHLACAARTLNAHPRLARAAA